MCFQCVFVFLVLRIHLHAVLLWLCLCCGCGFAVVRVSLWLWFCCGYGHFVSKTALQQLLQCTQQGASVKRFHRQTQTHTKSTAPGNPPTNQATQATTSCTPCQRSLPHQPSLAKLTIHPGPLIALPAPPSTVLKTSKHATNTPTTSHCLSDPKKDEQHTRKQKMVRFRI